MDTGGGPWRVADVRSGPPRVLVGWEGVPDVGAYSSAGHIITMTTVGLHPRHQGHNASGRSGKRPSQDYF